MQWRTGRKEFASTRTFAVILSWTHATGSFLGFVIGKMLSRLPARWRASFIRTDGSTVAPNQSGPQLYVVTGSVFLRRPRIEKSRMIPVWWVHYDGDTRPFGSWSAAMEYVKEINGGATE